MIVGLHLDWIDYGDINGLPKLKLVICPRFRLHLEEILQDILVKHSSINKQAKDIGYQVHKKVEILKKIYISVQIC